MAVLIIMAEVIADVKIGNAVYTRKEPLSRPTRIRDEASPGGTARTGGTGARCSGNGCRSSCPHPMKRDSRQSAPGRDPGEGLGS